MYSLSDEKQKRRVRLPLAVSHREDTGGNLKLRTVRTFATTQLPVNINQPWTHRSQWR